MTLCINTSGTLITLVKQILRSNAGTADQDINVDGAITAGFTGTGITVAVLDQDLSSLMKICRVMWFRVALGIMYKMIMIPH